MKNLASVSLARCCSGQGAKILWLMIDGVAIVSKRVVTASRRFVLAACVLVAAACQPSDTHAVTFTVNDSDLIGGVYDFHYYNNFNETGVSKTIVNGVDQGISNPTNTNSGWICCDSDADGLGGIVRYWKSTSLFAGALTMGWDFSAVTGTIAKIELQTQHFVFQFAPFGDDAAGDQIFGQIATPAASFGTAPFTDLYRITSNNPNNNPHNPPTTFNSLGSDSLLNITSAVGQTWLGNPELLEVKLGYQRDSDSTIPARHLQVFRDDTGTGEDAFILRVTMVPEPSALILAVSLLLGLVGFGWRKRW